MNPHQALITHSAVLPFPRESVGGRPGVCQGDSPDSPLNFTLVPALFPDSFVIQKKQQQTVLSALSVLGPRPSLWFGTESAWAVPAIFIERAWLQLQCQERLGPGWVAPGPGVWLRDQALSQKLGGAEGATPPTARRWAGLACPKTNGPT